MKLHKLGWAARYRPRSVQVSRIDSRALGPLRCLNLSGFVEFTFDWSDVNAANNCIDNNVLTFDGIIRGEDDIDMTITTFIETSSGDDTECQTLNGALTWPCETRQTIELTGPNATQ